MSGAFTSGFTRGFLTGVRGYTTGAFGEGFSTAFDRYEYHPSFPGDQDPDEHPPGEHPHPDPTRGAYSWAFSLAYDRDDQPPQEPTHERLLFEWWNREGGIDRAWYVGEGTYADAFKVRRRT